MCVRQWPILTYQVETQEIHEFKQAEWLILIIKHRMKST